MHKRFIPKPAIRKTDTGYMINGRGDIGRIYETKEQAYTEIAAYYMILRYRPGCSSERDSKFDTDIILKRLARWLQWRDQCQI